MSENSVAVMNQENTVATSSPIEMLMSAVDKGFNLDNLDRMLELQAKWEAQEARKAYHEAMAAFKADPPKIEKDRHVSYSTSKGKTEYSHASLANICEKVAASLSKHGLSAAWVTNQQERTITVTCTITHRMGHSESTSLSAGPDDSGGKNSIQAIGSTISYLERYTLLALTGLATHDMDDDGKGAGVQTITPEQVQQLERLLKESGADRQRFLKFMKIDSLEQMPEGSPFRDAVNKLEAKKKDAKVSCPNKDGQLVDPKVCEKCKHKEVDGVKCPAWDDEVNK